VSQPRKRVIDGFVRDFDVIAICEDEVTLWLEIDGVNSV
jgi:hypothetical protein